MATSDTPTSRRREPARSILTCLPKLVLRGLDLSSTYACEKNRYTSRFRLMFRAKEARS